MKIRNMLMAAVILSGAGASAQQVTRLPQPDLQRKTIGVMETFNQRHSTREFATKALTDQDLSDLLWAAQGKNRSDGRLTSPSAMNKQEIRTYVFTAQGVSRYNPQDHTLTAVVLGDQRSLLAAGQDFVKTAPAVLLYIADADKFGSTDASSWRMMYADAGIVAENVNLFCSAAGLVTVPRAMMDAAGIQKLLGLNANQQPVLNSPVGYPKE